MSRGIRGGFVIVAVPVVIIVWTAAKALIREFWE